MRDEAGSGYRQLIAWQKAIDKAVEQADTSMPGLSDEEGIDLENLEVSGGDPDLDEDTSGGRGLLDGLTGRLGLRMKLA